MLLGLSDLPFPCLPSHNHRTATGHLPPTVSATHPLLLLHPLYHHSHLLLYNKTTMIFKTFQIILFYCILATSLCHCRHRRILHHPFFPAETPSSSPELQPQPPPQPKYPFSSLPPPTDPQTESPFFPFYSAPQPPPSPTPPPQFTAAATFPANISSLIIPHSSTTVSKTSGKPPISGKFIALIVCFSLLSATIFIASAAFLLHRNHFHHRRYTKTDNLHLFPPDATPSDTITTVSKLKKPLPVSLPKLIRPAPASTSSEFLYLGTLVSSREANPDSEIPTNPSSMNVSESDSMHFQTLDSPELRPLPPLPRIQSKPNFNNYHLGSDEDEEFFSPRASTGVEKFSKSPEIIAPISGSRSSDSDPDDPNLQSSSPSILLDFTPLNSIISKSPDSLVNFPGPLKGIPPPPVRERKPVSPSTSDFESSPSRVSSFSSIGISERFPGVRFPPPVPPPLPPRYWEAPNVDSGGPPSLVAPSRADGGNENTKPKLKPLHWDKVRTSSDKASVWDHLKSSSFQLNEEMIETLFTVNGSSNSSSNPNGKRSVSPMLNQEFQVVDPKKSHNIAILLRALNVTIDEVCEALVEGNADMLGTELLESLLKMAPTRDEEQKLKEFKDESPFKLGPAEKFLKAVMQIPHAFSRVDAMLYIANFDSEVEYLKKSFQTLEDACRELKNSRMFMKLLEAVLKTGNRMNDGTNRGDAHAFNLDTLLKLVDVKGVDGKTTLLHFVVQEIIKAEGSRHDIFPNVECNEVELRKRGLAVVSSLSGELSNVRKAASMDSNTFNNDVSKLGSGLTKVIEILKLNEGLPLTDTRRRFSESMNGFLKKAEEDIIKIQGQESVAISMVKELIEYFHGNNSLTNDVEGHPFRIFMVVKDFLSILDQVCKDVGKMNDRTMVRTSREFPMPVNNNKPEEDESMF